MDREKIGEKIIDILSKMGEVKHSNIDLSKKLTTYIRKNSKGILAARIDVEFQEVNGTILYNALFSEIKTGEDIIEFIMEYYKNKK